MKILIFVICISFTLLVFNRVCRHAERIKFLMLFLFNPLKFANISAQEAFIEECQSNISLKEKSKRDDVYKQKFIKELRNQFLESTNELRNSIKQAFFTVLISLFLAYFTPKTLINAKHLYPLQLFSVFLILWGIVGKLEWEVQTFNGSSKPEEINRFWYLSLNIIGSFLLFYGYFYSLLN